MTSDVVIEPVSRWEWYCPECGDPNEADIMRRVGDSVECLSCGFKGTVVETPDQRRRMR